MNCAKSCESFFNIIFNVQVGTRNHEYIAAGVPMQDGSFAGLVIAGDHAFQRNSAPCAVDKLSYLARIDVP